MVEAAGFPEGNFLAEAMLTFIPEKVLLCHLVESQLAT